MRVCVHVHIRACLEKAHDPECILLQHGRESRESAQNPRNIQTVRHDSFTANCQSDRIFDFWGDERNSNVPNFLAHVSCAEEINAVILLSWFQPVAKRPFRAHCPLTESTPSWRTDGKAETSQHFNAADGGVCGPPPWSPDPFILRKLRAERKMAAPYSKLCETNVTSWSPISVRHQRGGAVGVEAAGGGRRLRIPLK